MQPQRFHVTLRIIHWLMAVIILSLLAMGLYMTGLEREDALRGTLYGLHKSFGVLVLLLLAVRLFLRVATHVPALPKLYPLWERGLAHLGHFALYLLMFGVPMAGIAMSNSGGHPVKFFGVVVPPLFEQNKEFGGLAHEAHWLLAYVLIGVIGLHLAGVIKHRFIDKQDILYRMTFGRIPANAAVAEETASKDA